MKNALIVALACIIGAAIGSTCKAQEMPKLNLKESPSPEVVFVPFTESQFPDFGRIFARTRAALQPAAFVVVNQSDRAVIAIAARWTVVTQDGSRAHYWSSTHMYLSIPPAPLAPAGGRLLVAPDTFVPESLVVSGRGMIGLAPDPEIVSKFMAASQIYAEVDCIIFGDGEVVGLDQSQLVAEIQDRKAAVDVVLKQVHAARANGENLSDALSQLATSARPANDSVGRRAAQFARQWAGTQHREAFLSYLEGIPAPVSFYRKDGGALR
jgi:hypothetical protein